MNISNTHNCFGCGVCAIACSKKIINIELNGDGFYEPRLTDPRKCTDCGLCIEVCAYSHDELATYNMPIASYGAWSNTPKIRRKCSSGGVGFELGRYLIDRGYNVCGVRYNTVKGIAEHYIASTVEDLVPSMGSKYIQSYTVEGFKAINRKEKNLVTGTPCQIDSFRRYIQKFRVEENFVLMDFFCHGVPSMLMWNQYVKDQEKKVGKLTFVSWRNKFTGWHDSWAMSMEGSDFGGLQNPMDEHKGKIYSLYSNGDEFYTLFLKNCCLGKACYDKCKYKYQASSADIRIGDAWGKHYRRNEEGVSVAIAFTEKGNRLLQECNIHLEELPFDIVSQNQMKECAKRNKYYDMFWNDVASNKLDLQKITKLILQEKKRKRHWDRITHPQRVLKNIVRRLLGNKK